MRVKIIHLGTRVRSECRDEHTRLTRIRSVYETSEGTVCTVDELPTTLLGTLAGRRMIRREQFMRVVLETFRRKQEGGEA